MNSTIDTLHYKITAKFDYLIEAINFLKNIYDKYKELSNINVKQIKNNNKISYYEYIIINDDDYIKQDLYSLKSNITNLYFRYSNASLEILSSYYDIIERNDNNQLLKKFDDYQSIITSENFINIMDNYVDILKKITNKLNTIPEFKKFIDIYNHLNINDFLNSNHSTYLYIDNDDVPKSPNLISSFKDILNKLIDMYSENKILFQIKTKSINDCECGSKMIMDSSTSYKICESCGCEIYMPGTVFDDSQFYNQQGQCNKHKKYDSNRHC